jgi:hypothetical protein
MSDLLATAQNVLEWSLSLAVAYRFGHHAGRHVRSARERRRRSWLAAKVWELRTEVTIRNEWARDLLEERSELLKERAAARPEMN